MKTGIEKQQLEWALTNMEQRKSSRNWAALPSQFEMDAVKSECEKIFPHLGRNDVTLRVNLYRATDFDHAIAALKNAVAKS